MMRSTIISCAITGGAQDTPKINPAVPVTPRQIADEAIAAAKAGAAIVHIHVRDPQTGGQSVDPALYAEVTRRIRDADVDVLINLTTGPGAKLVAGPERVTEGGQGTLLMSPAERVEHILELRPDLCSLDVATFNFGGHLFVNAIEHLVEMARLVHEVGVRTEIEVFDTGHLRLANHLIEKGRIAPPSHFQFCLGVPWGAHADPASMLLMQSQLLPDAQWSAFGVSRHQFPMVAQAVIAGGHVRVGLEDNLYLGHGVLAPGNAPLVERAAQIVDLLGGRVASAADARAMLKLQ